MVSINDFKHIEEFVYEVPTSYRRDMRVPARLYAVPECSVDKDTGHAGSGTLLRGCHAAGGC